MKMIDLYLTQVVGVRPSEEACNVIVIELSNGVRLEVISDDVKDKNGDVLEDAPR